MNSSKLRVETEGGWGIVFAGPHVLCGKEQRGGVAVRRIGSDGVEMPGEVMTREEARRLHKQLGEWIAFWDKIGNKTHAEFAARMRMSKESA